MRPVSPASATFPNPLAEFVYMRTYARFRDDLGRRETWPECVERVVAFLRETAEAQRPGAISDSDWEEVRAAILAHEVRPSSRLLSMAGEAARREPIAAYNCTYNTIDCVEAFAEVLYVLMMGCGAGFSVERRYTERLPVVQAPTGQRPRPYTIPDTTAGWADALKFGMTCWYAGEDVAFDYTLIRPAGARLRTKGGRASGPAPLRGLLDFVRALMAGAAGRRLTSAECHHIVTKIGDVVVMGGVRRSAEIGLSDFDDEAIRGIKQFGYWETAPHLAMANNSAVYEQRPSVAAFAAEWAALRASGSGERGIFNRRAARQLRPARRADWEFGSNPCFAPGTMVQTRSGHFPIEDLVGRAVEIWNGSAWQTVDNFRVTGRDQPVLRITFQDGSSERVTPYHTVILTDGQRLCASELRPGQSLRLTDAPPSHGDHHETGAYLKGFLVGDGTRMGDRAHLYLYAPKAACADRLVAAAAEVPAGPRRTNAVAVSGFDAGDGRRRTMQGLAPLKEELYVWATEHKRQLPRSIFAWDLASKVAFIAGVMDADGTASDTANGFLYQISSIHRSWLLDFQALLKTIGVQSKLALMKSAVRKDFGDGHGSYDAADCWRLTISQASAVALARQVRFERLRSFADKAVRYRLRPRRNRVVAIEEDGIEPVVYCCTVEGTHQLTLTDGLDWGQCGEVVLRPQGVCNLSEVVARVDDDLGALTRKIRLAALLGTVQSLLTAFGYLRPTWQRNAEEERLLGVSITGQLDCPACWSAPTMTALRDAAVGWNRVYARALGIPQSAAVTCVKPSGNSSQMVDCASGMHPRFAPFYTRRVRIGATDPLYQVIRDAGVPLEPENGMTAEDAVTWVAAFPVKAPAGAKTRDAMTALEQLDYWLMVKQHFTEHNPSQTVYVREHEWDVVRDWVYAHWDWVGGLSFLPYSDHIYPLAPYTPCSQAAYEAAAAAFPVIDYRLLSAYEQEDASERTGELACSGTSCELA